MVKTLRKAIGLLLPAQLAAVALFAQNPAIDTLFPARPTGYLTDAAHVVDASSASEIEDLGNRVRGATGAEIAVVTLPTIGDRAAVDVATEIGRVWKVGAAGAIGDAKRNAGVVLLLVPLQDHRHGTGQVFIATGRGVEGFITDARAGAIRDAMGPELGAESYGPALVTGVRHLAVAIGRGMGVSDSAIANWTGRADASDSDQGTDIPWPIILAIIFIVVRLIFWRMGRGRWGGPGIYWGGGFGGGFGGGGGGGFGGGFGGFGGGGGFSGGGAGGRF